MSNGDPRFLFLLQPILFTAGKGQHTDILGMNLAWDSIYQRSKHILKVSGGACSRCALTIC